MEDRKLEEIAFHDKRELDRQTMPHDEFMSKYSNKKCYAIDKEKNIYLKDFMSRECPDKIVLDYCCGLGQKSLEMAENNAKKVYGIDISPESVATSRNRLQENGYGDNSEFQVMDAEKLTFEDNMFDTIVCSGVLHHLDVNQAFPELARVLKKDGKIICIEALGYNPLITLYRKLTPSLRSAWEAEHILTLRDVKLADNWFQAVDVKYFYLFSIAAIPFQKWKIFNILLPILGFIDNIFLKIPYVQRMAWQMVFILSAKK
jgi:ubiquinone/menaquinone biosynthesis C-methylase UbiE